VHGPASRVEAGIVGQFPGKRDSGGCEPGGGRFPLRPRRDPPSSPPIPLPAVRPARRVTVTPRASGKFSLLPKTYIVHNPNKVECKSPAI
jgi:hypothetical protein